MAQQKLTARVGKLESRKTAGFERVFRLIVGRHQNENAERARLQRDYPDMGSNDLIVIRRIVA